MGKALSKIILFLLLGVVTTIAVAWSCALWAMSWGPDVISFPDLHVLQTPDDNEIYVISTEDNAYILGFKLTYSTTSYFGGIYRSRMNELEIAKKHNDQGVDNDAYIKRLIEMKRILENQLLWTQKDYTLSWIETGWPVYTMEGGKWMITNTEGAIRTSKTVFEAAIPINQNKKLDWLVREPRILPFRPKPIGFIFNSVFFGALWFGLFAGLSFARGKIRLKRGRCPKCAYVLRSEMDRGCPECGWNRINVKTSC